VTAQVVGHLPPRCGYCAHRNYLMSCEDFDTLVAHYEDRCGICRRAGHETTHGFLCIDHNPFVGRWAVRGLLCGTCNARLSIDHAWRPEAVAYLADPWYLRRFAELGLSVDLSAEPPPGSAIAAGGHQWHRTQHGWECQSRNGPRAVHSWDQLHRRYGPHRISFPAVRGGMG